MQRLTRFLLIVACALSFLFPAFSSAPSVHGPPTSQTNAPVVKQGKFRLHKMEQPIGEETYQVVKDGESLAVTMDFKFTDRGTDVPLTASFRAASDLTPEHFEIKGKTSRQSEIDEEVAPTTVIVRVTAYTPLRFSSRTLRSAQRRCLSADHRV